MAEHKDEMGTVTQHMSSVDDDLNKSGHIKEAHVASVALGNNSNFSLQRSDFNCS